MTDPTTPLPGAQFVHRLPMGRAGQWIEPQDIVDFAFRESGLTREGWEYLGMTSLVHRLERAVSVLRDRTPVDTNTATGRVAWSKRFARDDLPQIRDPAPPPAAAEEPWRPQEQRSAASVHPYPAVEPAQRD